MIEIATKAAIYRNPHPENWSVVASLPTVEEVGKDEILCVYRRGNAFMSPDGRIFQSRSIDGGETWVDEGLLHDASSDPRQYDYTGPVTTKLRDGAAIA